MAWRDEVLADSPWAFWRFGETSGTVAEDESVNNRDGTYNGSPVLNEAGRGDKAVKLVAANSDHVRSSAVFNSGLATLEGWFKVASLPASTRLLAGCIDGIGSGIHDKTISLTPEGWLSFYIYDGGGKIAGMTSGSIPLNEWFHVFATVDGTSISLYLNNSLVATTAAGNSFTGYTVGNVFVGGTTSDRGTYPDVTVDEFAVYPSALSAARRAAHYTADPGSGPSPRSAGTVSTTSNSVANPTNLTPGLPATRVNGDVMLLFTSCRLASAAVTAPAGWTQLLNVAGTTELALFARVVDGTETAPTVTWTGMTTGTSGSSAQAQIVSWSGLSTDLASIVDVLGAVVNQAASTTASSGGAAITTSTAGAAVMILSSRQDDAGTWAILPTSDGVGWGKVVATATTTTGSDHAQEWQWGNKPSAGVVAAKTFTLSGASSFASSGVMIALKPAAAGSALTQGPGDSLTLSDDYTSDFGLNIDVPGLADSMALTDNVTILITSEKTFADSVSLGDAVVKAPSMSISDSVAAIDSTSSAVARVQSDSMALGDSAIADTGRMMDLADSVSMTDSASRSAAVGVADVSVLTDAIQRATGLGVVDSVALIDAIGISSARSIADASTLTDAVAIVASLGIADAVTFADLVAIATALGVSDSAAVVDAIAVASSRVAVDTFALIDIAVLAAALGVSDNFAAADAIGVAVTLGIVDSGTLADVVSQAVSRSQSDSMTITDAANTTGDGGITINDTFAFTDLTEISVGKTLADSAVWAEALSWQYGKSMSDTLSLTDGVSLDTGKGFSDSVSLTDGLSRLTELIRGDSLVVIDAAAISSFVALGDILTMVEVLARATDLQLADFTSIVESIGSSIFVVQADSIVLTDNVAALRSVVLTDSLGFLESTSIAAVLQRADTLGMTDGVAVDATGSLVQSVNDALTFVDAVGVQVLKSLADSAGLMDSISRDVAQSFVEAMQMVDAVDTQGSYQRAASDALSLTDVVVNRRTVGLLLSSSLAMLDEIIGVDVVKNAILVMTSHLMPFSCPIDGGPMYEIGFPTSVKEQPRPLGPASITGSGLTHRGRTRSRCANCGFEMEQVIF